MSYAGMWAEHLRPHRFKVAVLALAILSGIGLQLLAPQIVRRFIDEATAGAPLHQLIRLAVVFMGAALANQVLAALSAYLSADVGWRATNALRLHLFRHAVGLDMRFHKDRTPGAMVERIDGDVTHLSNFFSQFAVKVAGGLLLIVGILALMWTENLWIGLAVSLYVLLMAWVLIKRREIAVPATQIQREANANLFGLIEERITGIDDIRANGAGRHVLARFEDVQRSWYRDSLFAWRRQISVYTAMMALSSAGLIGVLALGIWLHGRGLVTLGAVYLFVHYMSLLEGPLEEISRQVQEFQHAGAGARRAQALLEEKPTIVDGPGAALVSAAHAVRFEQVRFSYEDQAVLKGIDFTLNAGETMGLLGRTGSGKTTLVKLLFRLYDPVSGRILLDGVDTRSMLLEDLRRRVGMVTQDVQLFSGTIRDNLTFFDDSVSDDVLMENLRALGALEWVDGLPHGLDTRLGPGGSGLSAGEAQLLAFARLFLQDPGVVILDEPSSRLDPATERLLTRAVMGLLRGRTGIIIAHRLETVKNVDKIMILSDGAIVEFGDRARLLADPHSRYRAMLAIHSGTADAGLDQTLERLGI